MHDKKLILEMLEQIYDSAQKVLKRFTRSARTISRCWRKQ